MPARASLDEAARRVGAEAVEVEEVASNELLHERMLAGGPWDLVFPSDYLVERLIRDGALAPLAGLPLDRLAAWAREGAYDPGCRFSVPFAYGTTGYLVADAPAGAATADAPPAAPSADAPPAAPSADAPPAAPSADAPPRAPAADVPAGAASWATLLDPPSDVRVAMLDEVREVLGAALIFLGRSPNDVAGLDAARAVLERQRAAVVRYDSDDFVGPIVRGEVSVAHAWSGPASHAVRAHPGLRYVVPDEGAILWVTTGAIPADAPDRARSARFLGELMDPRLAARTTAENGYATPNDAARALLGTELRTDATLFPDADTRARCHALHDLGGEEARFTFVVEDDGRVAGRGPIATRDWSDREAR